LGLAATLDCNTHSATDLLIFLIVKLLWTAEESKTGCLGVKISGVSVKCNSSLCRPIIIGDNSSILLLQQLKDALHVVVLLLNLLLHERFQRLQPLSDD